MVWARCIEQDRAAYLADLATAVRMGSNASNDQFDRYVGKLLRMSV